VPKLSFQQINKQFGDSTVIKEFVAEVEDKEFLVLLGPSGCGKSTMLRMIAGLTDITAGELQFDGRRVNDLEPRERNVAFVFQSYALYPHMTVRDNIAFPLIMDRFKTWHHIPVINSIVRRAIARQPDVRARVQECADMLELGPYLGRRPKTLSGGQRQRVAVARALVREPSIYLLDEPLSNLDAKLRTQMRAEITALYRRVRKTFVYVTHDQVEAMTMGTRIIVLDGGVVQQFGTPQEIYERPANTFVAQFIGSPPMNLLPVEVAGGRVSVLETGLALPHEFPGLADGRYRLGVRPESITVTQDPRDDGLRAHVVDVEHLGGETVVGFRLGEWKEPTGLGDKATRNLLYLKLPGTVAMPVATQCGITFGSDAISWFDGDTGLRVEPADGRAVHAADTGIGAPGE
jgi:multiple sugar transport system ATP-binding protein